VGAGGAVVVVVAGGVVVVVVGLSHELAHGTLVVAVVVAGFELESVLDDDELLDEPLDEPLELAGEPLELVEPALDPELELLITAAELLLVPETPEPAESAAIAAGAVTVSAATMATIVNRAFVRISMMLSPAFVGLPSSFVPLVGRFGKPRISRRGVGLAPTAALPSPVRNPACEKSHYMRITLEQQRELYREHAGEAAERLIEVLRARLGELVELGFDRAFSTVGVHEYGDSTYWKASEQLNEEAAAELADAIFYLHIPVAREHGSLPAPDVAPPH